MKGIRTPEKRQIPRPWCNHRDRHVYDWMAQRMVCRDCESQEVNWLWQTQMGGKAAAGQTATLTAAYQESTEPIGSVTPRVPEPWEVAGEVEHWAAEREVSRLQRWLRINGGWQRQVVPVKYRPRNADKELCPRWTGGWLKVAVEGKRQQYYKVPLGCHKRYCRVCGPRVAARESAELVAGYSLSHGTAPAQMMTLTYQGRRSNASRAKTAFIPLHIESWDQYCARTGARFEAAKLPEEWERWRPVECVQWLNTLTPEDRVVARGAMTPKQWMKYISGCLRLLRESWTQRWATRWTYVCYFELTQQGIPHLHITYKIPTRRDNGELATQGQMQRFLEVRWAEIVGLPVWKVQVHAGRSETKGVAAAISYSIQYSKKDHFYENKQTQKSRARLLGDNTPQDWNTGLRRLRKSDDWPRADQGQAETFLSVDGEVVNRQEYRRAHRLAYYHLFQTDNFKVAYEQNRDPSKRTSKEKVWRIVTHWAALRWEWVSRQLDATTIWPRWEHQPSTWQEPDPNLMYLVTQWGGRLIPK